MPTHAEKRVVPFQADQMFHLVAEVERYPEFLPWCVGARIKSRRENVIHADLIIGFKLVRERFTSRVTLAEDKSRIDVAYTNGPFRYLDNHWIFNNQQAGSEIDFFVDFEFRNQMLQGLVGLVFNEAVQRMVSAFESRAYDLYKKPNAEIENTFHV
jgi:coenzyme Q-binding protein COQ10